MKKRVYIKTKNNIRQLVLFSLVFVCVNYILAQSIGIGAVQFVPSGMLEVRGTSTASTDYALKIRNSTPADLLVVQNNGNVGIAYSTPSYKLDVNGDARISGHASVGTWAYPLPAATLYCGDYITGGSASEHIGIQIETLLFPFGAAQTGDFIGISCIPHTNLAIGATVSNIYGIKTYVINQGGAHCTNLYNYYSSNPFSNISSPITNAYGLYIENIIAATNNYSIYSAGGQNYFAGKVDIGSSISLPVSNQTANYTVTASDHTIFSDATAGGFTVTLPTAVGITGRIYVIKKTDATANVVAVQTTGGQTIDGAAPPLNIAVANDRIIVQSNGTNWFRID